MSDAERSDDNTQDQDDSQQEATRESRDTGGDAPAAASLDEREAVARDEDDMMGGEDD